MDENLIITVWDIFREYIPEKNKEIAANQYVDFLLGKDVDVKTLESFLGYDPHLDDAISLVVDQESDEDFDEDSENYEEDEEY